MLQHFASFKIIYYISVWFGVMPVSLNRVNSGGWRIRKLTLKLLPLAWLLMLLFNDVTRIVDKNNILYKSEVNKNKERELTVKVIMTFEYWISNSLMIFNIIYGLKQTRALPHIMDVLRTMEKQIGCYFDTDRLRHIHRNEDILTKCLVLLCGVVTVTPIAASHVHIIDTFLVSTLSFVQIVIKDLSKGIIFSVELQFSILCIYIYHRMKLVNTLFADRFLRNGQKTLMDVPSKLKVTHRRFQGYKFDFRCQVDRLKILTMTKQNHELMYRLCEDVRTAYELQLMCSVGEIFFNVINHIYVTVKLFRPGELSYMTSIVNMMWAVQEVTRVVIFSLAASVTADELNKTLWYASSIDIYSVDSMIQDQVKCFTLHLQHRKLKFSLCKMITINTQFLASMTVGIVNSLMLSLQYKYSDKQSLSSNG